MVPAMPDKKKGHCLVSLVSIDTRQIICGVVSCMYHLFLSDELYTLLMSDYVFFFNTVIFE